MVAAIAALIGAALGWQFPFTGGRNESNQTLGTRQTNVQSRKLGQAQPRNQRTPPQGLAQAPNTTSSSSSSGATDTQQEPSDTSVKPPLW